MHELNGVLPALRSMKQFERLLKSRHQTIILLEVRLAQLKPLVRAIKQEQKQVLLHADLIQGLRADEHGMEYLVREVKPDGIISTRNSVITLARKNRLLAVQRLFILDSQALDHNIRLIQKAQPDYIEVLPGIVPSIIKEVHEKTGIPVIAGGLIRTKEEVGQAYSAGAKAISTSRSELWEL